MWLLFNFIKQHCSAIFLIFFTEGSLMPYLTVKFVRLGWESAHRLRNIHLGVSWECLPKQSMQICLSVHWRYSTWPLPLVSERERFPSAPCLVSQPCMKCLSYLTSSDTQPCVHESGFICLIAHGRNLLPKFLDRHLNLGLLLCRWHSSWQPEMSKRSYGAVSSDRCKDPAQVNSRT